MSTREDLPALHALGFTDDEIKELGLWEPATGEPADLAEAYIRRSKKTDTLATLRKHLKQIVAYAAREQKSIRHVWFEQRSASKASVVREEFDNAVAAMKEGKSRTFYAWKLDRFSRRGMGQVGALLDEFEKRGARLVSVIEALDSSLPGMRIVFALLSERARDEAKDITLRVKIGGDAHKELGRWPGGRTPFGLLAPENKDGKLRRHPDEYPISRSIAERLLKGITPAKIAADLNANGVKSRTGKNWTTSGIISLAHAVTWAGLIPMRERMTDEYGQPLDKYHRGGNPLMDAKGHPVSAGEGVVTFAERERILAILKSRSIPGTTIGSRTRGKRAPVALLSGGIFECPHCAGPMANSGVSYRCLARTVQGPTQCKGASAMRKVADEIVETRWHSHILTLTPESPTLHSIARRWLSYQDPEKEQRKAAVSAALDNALSRELRLQKEFFLGSNMNEHTFEALRNELATQIEGLKSELATLTRQADLSPLMSAESLTALWESENVDGRRALIAAAAERVTVVPVGRTGSRGAPLASRIVITWRDTEHVISEEVIDAAMRTVERLAEAQRPPGLNVASE